MDLFCKAAAYFLEGTTAFVRFEPMTSWPERDVEYGYCQKEDDGSYTVYIDNSLPTMAMLNVLSHECIHVHQFSTGRLNSDYGIWIWEGEIWEGEDMALSPWEIEANGLSGYHLARFLWSIGQEDMLSHKVEARFML